MLKIDWSGKTYNYTDSEFKYFTKVIKNSDTFTQGGQLKKFEHELRKFLKKKNIFATSSAAASLEIIALLLNIKKGDEIIIPAHTYCASAIPFARHGARIVWVDINENRVIDLSDLKKKITNKTKAVVAVHLYGFCIDVGSIRKIVGKKVKIIEDCAQAFGSQFKGKKAGTTGDYSCYSFHSQKNLTTLGEGGAVFIKSNLESKKVAGLRHNGHSNFKFSRKDYWIPAMGNVDEDLKNFWPYKFTLSEIQCAAGYLGIKKINKYNQIRINRDKKIIKYLSNIKELEFNKFFYSKRHVYHLLVAKCKKNKYFSRDDLIRILYKKYKIKCIVQYYPLYKYDLFKKKGFGTAKCPNTESYYSKMISFPHYVHMSKEKFNYMIKSVINAVRFLKK